MSTTAEGNSKTSISIPTPTTIFKQSFITRSLLLLIMFIIFICIANIYGISLSSHIQFDVKPTTRHHLPLIEPSTTSVFKDSFNILNVYTTNSDRNISSNPSLPALAIIGPAKTGTTSIFAGLTQNYNVWIRQSPNIETKGNRWEIDVFIQYIMHSIWKNKETLAFIRNNISMIHMPISTFPFFHLLQIFDQYTLNKTIINYINRFIINENNILIDYNHEMMRYHYMIDKTPMNFYIPHIPLIFGYYFSYKNVLQHVRGLKVLCILRNPYKRYRSWFSQNCAKLRHRTPPETFGILFNESCMNMMELLKTETYLTKIRNMIIKRRNEYDDTEIVMEWIKWYYGVIGYNIHNTQHGIFASFYYPQLLLYIYLYKQLGLLDGDRRMFKVIGFDYIIENGKYALHLIQCWVRFGLDNLELCLSVQQIPETSVLEKLNTRSLPFPDVVRNYLSEYFEPMTVKVQQLLLRHPTVILGDFNGFQELLH